MDGVLITGGYDDFSLNNLPEIAMSSLGLNLLLRFSSKLKKASKLCKNSFDGQTLVATQSGLVPI